MRGVGKAGAVLAVLAAGGLGACGGGSSAAPKVGDCIDSGSQVVDCGSSSAAQKLVSDQSKPNAIACVQIGAAPQSEVKVGGTTFCAEPAHATGTTTGGSEPATAAFKPRFERVTNKMKATAIATAKALQGANAYTNVELAKKFVDLSTRWQTDVADLVALEPPKPVMAEFGAMKDAAENVEGDMHRMIAAAATNNARAARHLTGTLLQGLLATKHAAILVERQL